MESFQNTNRNSIHKDIEDIKKIVNTSGVENMGLIRSQIRDNQIQTNLKNDSRGRIELEEINTSESAPLFIKINHYKNLLSSVNYLKTSMEVVGNSFTILEEIEKLRSQTFNVINDTISKIDEKLKKLDNEITKPSGQNIGNIKPKEIQNTSNEKKDKESYDKMSNVENSVFELKDQIQNLKTELKRI